jgi:hypothetical protein
MQSVDFEVLGHGGMIYFKLKLWQCLRKKFPEKSSGKKKGNIFGLETRT